MAAANGHEETIRLLLDLGASVTLANAEGNTALHWACAAGSLPAAKLLLDAQANACALNTHEQTPMDEALQRGRQDIVDLINKYNAPSKDADEIEIPDDAEEAKEGDEMTDE
jgi:uncharacterized protein